MTNSELMARLPMAVCEGASIDIGVESVDSRIALVGGAVVALDFEKQVLHFPQRAAVNGGGEFFIHTEDCSMGWRGQIQSYDVSGFRFETWIVGSHEMAQPMRLQPVAPPDASDAHAPDAEFVDASLTAPGIKS